MPCVNHNEGIRCEVAFHFEISALLETRAATSLVYMSQSTMARILGSGAVLEKGEVFFTGMVHKALICSID